MKLKIMMMKLKLINGLHPDDYDGEEIVIRHQMNLLTMTGINNSTINEHQHLHQDYVGGEVMKIMKK